MENHGDILAIVEELRKLYPEGLCSLQYSKSYELLFSICLAAQCTNKQVNMVTPALLARFPALEFPVQADPTEVETHTHSIGFFRAKAWDIVAASRILVEQYSGRVPDTTEELFELPGAGRKTANLILGDVYHTPGIVVADTHCVRITGRLGLTDDTKNPAKVEKQLRSILPSEEFNDFHHRMVLRDRVACMARRPDYPNCTPYPWCDFYTKS